jgi:hypothetical protein
MIHPEIIHKTPTPASLPAIESSSFVQKKKKKQ